MAAWHETRVHWLGIVLLAASLLVGLGHIALLPPWEGFDEPAHLSYMKQINEERRIPYLGDRMAADMETYADFAPMPYDATMLSTHAERTYGSFFRQPHDLVEEAARRIHAARPARAQWAPGRTYNWELQHPPLYYALLAPVVGYTASWNLVDQLFLLRSISYGLAWIALCIAFAATTMTARRLCGAEPVPASLFAALRLAPCLWPFVFPGWFPEMARLGNDALMTLLVAIAWLTMLRASRTGSLAWHLVLGVICGLAMLTKATALPMIGVLFVFLLMRAFWGGDGHKLVQRTARLLGFLACIAAVAAWWYLDNFHNTGNPLGAADLTRAQEMGGLLSAVFHPHFVVSFAKGWASVLGSFVWGGTWSFAKPPIWTIALLCLLPLALAAGHLAWLRSAAGDARLVPLAVMLVFLIGLAIHLVAFMAITGGRAGTPGWYLHTYAPVFATITGTGMAVLLRATWLRHAVVAAIGYAFAFLPFVELFDAFVYAGCGGATRATPGGAFNVASMVSCAADPAALYRNLDVLAQPGLALALFVPGFTALGVCAWKLRCLEMRMHRVVIDPVTSPSPSSTPGTVCDRRRSAG